MYAFQAIAFILELVLFLGGAISLIFISDIFLVKYLKKKYRYRRKSIDKYILDDSGLNNKIIKSKIFKIFLNCFAVVCIYLAIPYVRDIPQLVTGNLEYINGRIHSIENREKDSYDRITVGGEKIKFFLKGNVQIGKNYKIGYLSNTKRGISLEELEEDFKTSVEKIGFPYRAILFNISMITSFIVIILLLYYCANTFGYKSLYMVNFLFYPISITSLIFNGVKTGIWISVRNLGFLALAFGVGSLVLLFLLKIIYRGSKEDRFTPLFYATIVTACEIGFIVVIIYNFYELLIK